MVLLSEKFVILDECFFRAPGLDVMRDVPKPYIVPSDTKVSFEKHIATLDNAVFEEEKVCFEACIYALSTDSCSG